MLKKLHIQRFRSIHDATLELGRVNVFIGPNGAGKSNVLEAIGILSAALGRGLDSVFLGQKGVRLSVPHMFKSSFKGLDHPKTFALDATLSGASKVRYKCSIAAGEARPDLHFNTEALYVDGEQIFGRSPRSARLYKAVTKELEQAPADPIDGRSLWDSHRRLLSIPADRLSPLALMEQFAIFAPQTSVMRGQVTEHSPTTPLGLHGSGMSAALRSMWITDDMERQRGALRSIRMDVFDRVMKLSDWAESLTVGAPDSSVLPQGVTTEKEVLLLVDRFMRSDRNHLSPFDASEGTLYLLFVGLLLVHPATPPLFALDNVDSTLNPALVRALVDLITEAVCATEERGSVAQQVFLTTHNPTALDALDLFNDDHRVFVVHRDRKAHGSTKFLRLKPPDGMTREEWVIEKHGRKLSNLWIDGRLPFALG